MLAHEHHLSLQDVSAVLDTLVKQRLYAKRNVALTSGVRTAVHNSEANSTQARVHMPVTIVSGALPFLSCTDWARILPVCLRCQAVAWGERQIRGVILLRGVALV